MGIRLRPKNPAKYLVGNGIIYGGEQVLNYDPQKEITDTSIFFVESDYGNHMRLSWTEIEEMYTIAGWQDYSEWRQNRASLRKTKPFGQRTLSENDEAFLQDILKS